ncbi:hypothetical protein ADICYQ_0846 [Cyclobacterium qasimii M12-11B]|uniref:Uncharacterized protein n=1 Tax=Cyclobacterium qasimii M12-11B TaxID=641524 RepID=S7VKZ3_9BACT|nr:hypothetical protein ADICYQ_0846 [Cyclobacterium qasimii M12-11B]
MRGTFLLSYKKIEAGYNPCIYCYFGYYFYALLGTGILLSS